MNAINWFEIFVSDLNRARAFYEQALDTHLELVGDASKPMAIFPYSPESAVGGSLTVADTQNDQGNVRIYLNVEGKLDAVIARVPGVGGRVLQPRTSIAPHGFIAVMEDCEGNVVGLHSLS